jgi:DNA-directed RNA polymerase specialized sigma24 family protein
MEDTMARRENYNILLIESVNYKRAKGIRRLFNKWDTLELLARRGDQVAHSILIDLKTCLGEYPHSPTTLSTEEIALVKKLLIIGLTQKEIAGRMGVTQKTVSDRLSRAIHKISEMLKEGEE